MKPAASLTDKKYKYMAIAFTAGLSLYACFSAYAIIDRIKVETRLYFTTTRILLYKEKYGHYPKEITNILPKAKMLENESWCDFYDKDIPGWGYCYYSVINDNFYIDIRGELTALTYNSDLDRIENSYDYDL